MSKVLYKTDISPPSRAVLLTIKALGLDIELNDIDLPTWEEYKKEFSKINPQHSIPTLVDGDFVTWDSHAINAYLIRRYSKDNPLYPEDACKRAVVDQRLHYDTGVLFPLLRQIGQPMFRKETKTPLEKDIESANEAYRLIEIFLGDNDWVAGDTMTIADFSLITVITTLDFFVPVTAETYPKVSAWIQRCQGLPYYEEVNGRGLEKLKEHFKAAMAGE